MVQELTYSKTFNLKNPLYVDVRSPGEFREDHIPNAINLPIFKNNERSEIGTIYKMIGRNQAIVRGAEIVGQKISNFIEEISKYKEESIILYCSRGGMRSGTIAALLDSLGISVYKIEEGYKGYRRYVREFLEDLSNIPKIVIIQGLTGTGKTEIIQYIPNSIDLEKMAGHRSSIFGAIGLKQNSQKRFETLLVDKLNQLKNEKIIFVEGESQKVGTRHIPQKFFDIMKQSPALLVEAPMKRRTEILVSEYTKLPVDEEIIEKTKTLKSKLGNKTIEELVSLIKQKNYELFTEIILEKYYDPRYSHKLSKLDYIFTVANNNSKESAKIILEKIKNFF